ncbi:TonB-dependent receptor domain-containing protein [Altererythrobacter lauratis]|uniref:TonB-dependent receptor domain-containing protein n=1 Tax=Alteraurantiacibacter lauratis TaxID=2054627 RepID=A0ABV7EIX3_9SPHN
MTNSCNRFHRGASVLALAAAALTATAAQAQSADPAEDMPQASSDAIIVTGSRIRGIEPVGSNVIGLNMEEILAEPVISTNDILRRVPQVVSLGANRQGGAAQNGAANATRGAGINLRGISTNATLLLHDGRRFPPQGTQGQFTDPSVIPSIALGRVEVVADGASAIYGSDAIAGVVNLILRTDVDGIEGRVRYGFTEGDYNEKQVAVIGGHRWDTGRIMLAAEYSENNPLLGAELAEWYQQDNRARGGRDLRNTNCAPGTISVGGNTYAIPAGGVTPATVGQLQAGTRNLCFYGDLDHVIWSQERTSFVGAFSQDIGPVRFFADGFYSERTGELPITAQANVVVPSTNPFFVTPVPGATSVTVNWSATPIIGLQMNPYKSDSWNGTVGLEADLFGDFRGTVYYAYGKSSELADRRRNGFNTARLNAALADTNPATALNVFGGPVNLTTLNNITDNLFVIIGKTRLEVINGQIDGSLFALAGGDVRIALGAEHRTEYTFTDLLTGTSANIRSTGAGGSRNVDAVFGELFVPVVGGGNASPGLEELSLSLALRHEEYSDFGNTTNPKIGLTWVPVDGVTVKGSYGTSFRAPTFTETSTVAGGAGLYPDTLPGPGGGNLIGIGLAGGNPGLRPETATTWSASVELAPVALPGFNASLSYFRIDYKDQIQALRGTPGLLTNPLYADFVQFNPTLAEVNALINSGLPVNGTINAADVTFIADGRRQNLGTTLMRGLDFMVSYDWEMGAVDLSAGVQGSYVLKYVFEAVPGAGLQNVLNTIGFAHKFRTQSDLTARIDALRARLVWNYLNGYRNTTVTPVQKVSDYNTFDLSLNYDINDNFSIGADVRNLFDANPPFVDTTNGWDPQSASPFPRMFAVTAGFRF